MIMAPRQNRPRLRDRIIACCREAGFEPRVVQEAVTKRTEVALVAAAVGIALVPASYRHVPQPGVVYRTLIKSTLPMVEVVAVWRDKLPRPALAELLKIVRGRGPG